MSATTNPAPIDASEYKTNGVIRVKQLFQPHEVDAARSDAKEVFLSQMLKRGLVASRDVSEEEFEASLYRYFREHLAEFVNCATQVQHLLSLQRMSLDPRVIEALKKLGLDFPITSMYPSLYFNTRFLATKEHYWRLAQHQDWRILQGSLDAVVVWVALVDVDRALGALEVIPGSHKWGLLEADVTEDYGRITAEIDPSRFVTVEVEKGDALFFSSLLVHRSGTNVTRSIRWSCHFRYNNLNEETFVERGLPWTYVYKPKKDLITDGFPSRELLARFFERKER